MPEYPHFKNVSISPEGFAQILQLRQKGGLRPGQHTVWTDDYRVELPIRVGEGGVEGLRPSTLVEEWRVALAKFGGQPAHSVKRGGKWVPLLQLRSPPPTNSSTGSASNSPGP